MWDINVRIHTFLSYMKQSLTDDKNSSLLVCPLKILKRKASKVWLSAPPWSQVVELELARFSSFATGRIL